ncbi:MAG: 30S ribosomal protein S1 [Actinomycetota bacterium]|nr:30S ribosomal protein S1 [Actinomycetota bacterium]
MSSAGSGIGSFSPEMPQSNEIVANDIGGNIEDLVQAIDATIKPFSDGDLVTGTVVKIDKEEVLVDIGYKSEGVIPARELSIRHDVDPSEIVSLGEQIEALVLQKEDKEGRLILSKKRASYERAWGRIEEFKRQGKVVKGTVIEVVKGGLIVDVGLRGFLPASLVDLRRVRDLQQFVGKELECKIIELDKNRNNVVLSRRAYLEEAHSEQRKDFLANLKVGERRKGTVSSVVNFGAFVDLGGVDGLVHVSELSWRHVDHPSEVVQVGQEIEVEVLSVEPERDRVSLSLKNTQEDPWQAFARAHGTGDSVKGVVTKLVPFGAFIKVADGIEGLAHISELAEGHIEVPEQVVQLGQEVQVRVIDVDLERRRISLSLKQAGAGAAPRTSSQEAPSRPAPGEAEPAKAAVPARDFEVRPSSDEEDLELELEPEPYSPVSVQATQTTSQSARSGGDGANVEAAQGSAPPATQTYTGLDEEMDGELLESSSETPEESLEAIVETMKRDRA